MTFRIKIEELNKNGKHKHIKDVYLDTLEDIEKLEQFVGYLKYAMRKSTEAYQKTKEKELEDFLESDLFDKHSVGKDISAKEFYKNEIDEYLNR